MKSVKKNKINLKEKNYLMSFKLYIISPTNETQNS